MIAIESHSDHINDALKTKELNNIQNVEFIKGKVEDELGKVFDRLGGDVPIIPIIDPPRQGLGKYYRYILISVIKKTRFKQ